MSKQNSKLYMKTAKSLRDAGLEHLAIELEAKAAAAKALEDQGKAQRSAPFTPEQIEVKGFMTDNGLQSVIGNGYKCLSAAQWIKYLSNPATVQRLLELSHGVVNGTVAIPAPKVKTVA